MSRTSLLQRFGPVEEWLSERIERMSLGQWTLFYDEVEAGRPLPRRFEDWMPRSHNGLIENPIFAPPEYQAQELAKWTIWKRIWGAAPWEIKSSLDCRPRLQKWHD